jgi:hypothetical protein
MHFKAERYPWIAPRLVRVLVALCLVVFCNRAQALEYLDANRLAERLKALTVGRADRVRWQSVVKSAGQRDVWLVELGVGPEEDRKRRPAILVVAGIEGNDLTSTVSASAWIEQLATGYDREDTTRKLLDSTTIYVFPRVNPDAAEHFFAKPKFETAVNDQPVDDDHDGLSDEDGPEDLDGDGQITWMRVKDPEGEYIADPAEPRLLLKADRTKGEVGAWRWLSEGRDNDGDEAWNEDGPGGVNLNRNFPYNYKYFAPWAGRHQMSEPETRALADFVVSHPNIGVVFTFGAADNLVQTPKGEAPKRPPVAIHEEDIPFYRELGKAWRETLGLKKELQGNSEPGTFSDWLYFHRGRLSLAARGWSPALQLGLAKANDDNDDNDEKKEAKPKDEAKAENKEEPPAKPTKKTEGKADARGEEERAFLKWAEANAPELFVPWKAFAHPDFPGKTVEIGGFAPFAKTNPPEKLLEDLAKKHSHFLTDLAGKLPRVGIRKTAVIALGESVYDVRVQVENTGYLPTSLAQGNVTREVYPTRVVLTNIADKALLSGTKRTMLGPIEGSGGMKEVRWVIHAKGRIDLEVVSMLGGTVRTNIDLKEEK